MRPKKATVIIVIAFIVTLVACLFIIEGVRNLTIMTDSDFNNITTTIFYNGQKNAISQIFSVASGCKQLPITVDNKTLTLVAVECLQNT